MTKPKVKQEESKETPSTATPTTAKAPKMATAKDQDIDFSKMTAEQLLELSEKAAAAAKAQVQAKFEEAINFVVSQAKALRRSNVDVANAILLLMSSAEKKAFLAQHKVKSEPVIDPETGEAVVKPPRAARGTAEKKPKATADHTGAMAVPGATYVLNGKEWTKSPDGKGMNKEFLTHVKEKGVTWESLRKS